MKHPIIKTYGFVFAAILLASCSKQDDSVVSQVKPHYEVGQPYQLGDRWLYPEENFAYRGTGIAVASSKKAKQVTADGEIYAPQSMTGAHPTLQLPAIVTVRNLENGREITIRLNDRPISTSDRILELTPKAAELLGISRNSEAKVEIIEDEKRSQDLAYKMPDGPQTQMQVNTAPLSTIKVENLEGSPQSVNSVTHSLEQPTGKSVQGTIALEDLPVEYRQGAATGGQLWIDGGSFTSSVYASRLAAKMGGRLVNSYTGGRRVIRVRSGPYTSIEQADQNLDSLLKSGIKGAKIIVE
ncbi:SPOR domain-containing protein [Commensalibacter nepenthis]|uniref:RlpA-like double-psi beta-barrel domain-containing protein n=1 Tax=Commensalibacter nepenthis TaxID=3043872 RepID=A0ABT6Q6F6_9PROT|nr:SPOR domain-containing protein [Commensalibacter sp. TBRC 10068]MDI2111828.1 RlpA-like double-psi beta-barrel domain-containing protein [Commensalibacter sp. TBRC 10068]